MTGVLTLEGRKNHFDILLDSLTTSKSLRIQQENLQKRSTDDAGRMDTIRRTLRTLLPGGRDPGGNRNAAAPAGDCPAGPG